VVFRELCSASLQDKPEHYLYSFAIDFAGDKGLLEGYLVT
jgi:hypothetical protein